MGTLLTAVVPVKGNSSRLPNKNILPFGESTLLVHKIRQLKKVKGIADIVVSSDSELMLEMAAAEGVIAMRRPKQYADESVPFGMFLEYLAGVLPNEHVMWACATSPLVEPYLYDKAISLYFEKLQEGFDSLITVLPCKSYYMDDKGPINFETGLKHQNSEYLKPIYHFTNGINICPKEKLAVWHYNYGSNPYRLEVNKREAADIDDIYDYMCAKAMLDMGKDLKEVGQMMERMSRGGIDRKVKRIIALKDCIGEAA